MANSESTIVGIEQTGYFDIAVGSNSNHIIRYVKTVSWVHHNLFLSL